MCLFPRVSPNSDRRIARTLDTFTTFPSHLISYNTYQFPMADCNKDITGKNGIMASSKDDTKSQVDKSLEDAQHQQQLSCGGSALSANSLENEEQQLKGKAPAESDTFGMPVATSCPCCFCSSVLKLIVSGAGRAPSHLHSG